MNKFKMLLLGSVVVTSALTSSVCVVSCSKFKKNPFKTVIDNFKGKNKGTTQPAETPATNGTTQGAK